MIMTIDILALYKSIIPVKNATQLSYEVPEIKQRDYLESMIDFVVPDQDPKVLLMITKLYIHFVSFGATTHVKEDAFTSMMILKSFSIKQRLHVMQELIFNFYFHLLYSRHLSSDQKKETMLEFAEFGCSDNDTILLLFLCFYFDTKSNPDYNLFQHQFHEVSFQTIKQFCDVYVRITKESIDTFPVLKPEVSALSLETIQQRFYNQFVYGAWGLKTDPYESIRSQLIIDCLVDCASFELQSAKKALIKCVEFLYHQQHSAESKNNADYLIALDQDMHYAMTKIATVSFGKLQPQWDKLVNKL